MRRLLSWLLLAVALQANAQTTLLDDFGDASAWQAAASDDVQASAVRAADGSLCLRYDFGRVSGYALLARPLALDLPAHYALGLRLRGSGPANSLQLKLVDASGDNVWWFNRPGFEAPRRMQELRVRQRQIEFAWGPTADRTLSRSARLELVVASGAGGRGELCFERLLLQTLPDPGPTPAPVLRAGTRHWQLDLGLTRELHGVLLCWGPGVRASDFDLQHSLDGRQWHTLRRVRGSQRDVLPIWLADNGESLETRHLRLQLRGGPRRKPALADFQPQGPAEWPSFNAALQSLAAAEPPGHLPRAFRGEQNYWTLVGVDGGGAHAALISEDGAIEPHRAGPSLEPFVIDEAGAVVGWAGAGRITHSLRDGYLPLPQLQWSAPGFDLAIEAGAEGQRQQAGLIARYTLRNTGSRPRVLTLALALRPWQVNPPQQFLNTAGGVSATVRRVAWRPGRLLVNGRPWLQTLDPPTAVRTAAFDTGDPLVLTGPPRHAVSDPQRLAGAALRWRLVLQPGASRSVAVVLPLVGVDAGAGAVDRRPAAERLNAIAEAWRARLNRVRFILPPQAQPLHDSLRSALAQILISRDGPALQPGTRSYARSWVRDGAMMVAGLLRLGEVDAARDFVQWYAGHVFANGKVPCCVDARGADPVAENDSHGQFIHAAALLWRHTGDRALIAPLWPKVDAAARYMEQLRQSERTPANREPARSAFFGLMPASISHEGYSAKPMHAYWDDYWALAGYRDAAALARAFGSEARAAELALQLGEFRSELRASLNAAVAMHGIRHLPGAAELGDFDPSSSTMIFSPGGAEHIVPADLLDATWDRYWQESQSRQQGGRDWQDYTPYELRSVAALLRLGRPEQAQAMLDFFLHDQRPAGWNQWAEVVGRLPRQPRFVGDMPHAWIASDFIRSALDLLAYERESDDALVLGAGVPEAWWRAGPVAVQGLSTPWGPLGWRLEPLTPQSWQLQVAPGLGQPPGGIWFAWNGQLIRVPASPAVLTLVLPP